MESAGYIILVGGNIIREIIESKKDKVAQNVNIWGLVKENMQYRNR